MITAEEFCHHLAGRGFSLASGVPCSHFGGPIAFLGQDPGRYVPAANEGGAVAIAVGAALAGQRSYVMLQNSGLGNLINPLTSLVMTYRMPLLTFVSLRGWPDPATDEPQHAVMGPATPALLDAVGCPHWTIRKSDDTGRFANVLGAAEQAASAGRAPFLLVERGAIGHYSLPPTVPPPGLASVDVLRLVTELAEDAAIVATTGYTSRELFAVDDRPGNFYMQGSMGHAISIGLGAALARPNRKVIVLDGDGAALMHMGSMSVVGHQAPVNLLHVILDNGAHESTGGQPTTSSTTSFADVAGALGYRSHKECDTMEGLRQALSQALASPGPHLCSVRTAPRTGPVPPRATNALTPEGIRDRFASFLQEG